MTLILLISIWLLLGICGCFMMRQGFYVAFESVLGKKGAWGWLMRITSVALMLCGGFAPLFAVIICRKDCFRKRIK